ncbi:MAG TPA: LysR substrate-binding domain-containing protein [Duganella sp.]
MNSRYHLDLDALHSFVMGIELGSFAKAADRVGRSTSAVSSQLRKLEEQVGVPLVRKAGRGLAPTPAGEVLLGYARRMLSLNEEALLAASGGALEGAVRLGLQEDFSERLLPAVLGRFNSSHPNVRIEVKVGRNAELIMGLQDGGLDLVLAWHSGPGTAHMSLLGDHSLRWIGPTQGGGFPRDGAPVPLVTFDAPCRMRAAAIAALDGAGIPWRIVYSSPSLAGVWAAVAAGLGVTVRTTAGMPSSLAPLADVDDALPPLPRIGLALSRSRARLPEAADRMRQMIEECMLH